ncbi:MAG: cysteine--tRNA ligase [Leptospirillia bacterium]
MSALTIFNTQSGKKEVFTPLDPAGKKVGIYVCGVTVYDLCHMGHARSAITFDVIRNYLIYKGYSVRFVKNFTDIDDKIINRANEGDGDWKRLVDEQIGHFYDDMARIGVATARTDDGVEEPRATDHIGDIIELVQRLVDNGTAYVVDGDVYFAVERFDGYGKLSGRKQEDLEAGARVEVDARKQNPSDFALWKSSKPGEPSWPSPWGEGRPGWHIECSAMSMKRLGETFDIHGGGKDLMFPHHENEVAQSEAATGKPFVNLWVHNGFVNVNAEKMSKSLGNFFTIRDVFEQLASEGYKAPQAREMVRYFMLGTHYKKPLDFDHDGIVAAKEALNNLYRVREKLDEAEGEGEVRADVEKALSTCRDAFETAMDDDFNTSGALAALQMFRTTVNAAGDLNAAEAQAVNALLERIGNTLGVLKLPLGEGGWTFSSSLPAYIEGHWTDEQVQNLVEERLAARKAKDFARSDEIRNQLSDAGIILEDRPDGTTRWKR